MNGFIEVRTTNNQKLLVNPNYISGLITEGTNDVILVLNNGHQYKLKGTYEDMKCRLFDFGRPMTL